MTVQFNALRRGVILSDCFERIDLLDRVDRLDHDFLLELIEIHHALDEKASALFESICIFLQFFRQKPQLEPDTVRVICHRDVENDLAVPRLPCLHSENFPADDHLMGILPEFADRDRILPDPFSKDHIRVTRHKSLLLAVALF